MHLSALFFLYHRISQLIMCLSINNFFAVNAGITFRFKLPYPNMAHAE